jgi:hypothetical protein
LGRTRQDEVLNLYWELFNQHCSHEVRLSFLEAFALHNQHQKALSVLNELPVNLREQGMLALVQSYADLGDVDATMELAESIRRSTKDELLFSNSTIACIDVLRNNLVQNVFGKNAFDPWVFSPIDSRPIQFAVDRAENLIRQIPSRYLASRPGIQLAHFKLLSWCSILAPTAVISPAQLEHKAFVALENGFEPSADLFHSVLRAFALQKNKLSADSAETNLDQCRRIQQWMHDHDIVSNDETFELLFNSTFHTSPENIPSANANDLAQLAHEMNRRGVLYSQQSWRAHLNMVVLAQDADMVQSLLSYVERSERRMQHNCLHHLSTFEPLPHEPAISLEERLAIRSILPIQVTMKDIQQALSCFRRSKNENALSYFWNLALPYFPTKTLQNISTACISECTETLIALLKTLDTSGDVPGIIRIYAELKNHYHLSIWANERVMSHFIHLARHLSATIPLNIEPETSPHYNLTEKKPIISEWLHFLLNDMEQLKISTSLPTYEALAKVYSGADREDKNTSSPDIVADLVEDYELVHGNASWSLVNSWAQSYLHQKDTLAGLDVLVRALQTPLFHSQNDTNEPNRRRLHAFSENCGGMFRYTPNQDLFLHFLGQIREGCVLDIKRFQTLFPVPESPVASAYQWAEDISLRPLLCREIVRRLVHLDTYGPKEFHERILRAYERNEE